MIESLDAIRQRYPNGRIFIVEDRKRGRTVWIRVEDWDKYDTKESRYRYLSVIGD